MTRACSTGPPARSRSGLAAGCARRRSEGAAMRIYEGSPRQDFEEVFRSIGAFLDSHGMRDILLLEVPDGFIVQGLVTAGASAGRRGRRPSARITKETLSFLDDDIAKFMEEAAARRGLGRSRAGQGRALRAGAPRHRPLDGRRSSPKDVFLFEQDGVVRRPAPRRRARRARTTSSPSSPRTTSSSSSRGPHAARPAAPTTVGLERHERLNAAARAPARRRRVTSARAGAQSDRIAALRRPP